MAAQLIEVPGHGQIEFPAEMSDDDIGAAIKRITAPPNPFDKVTPVGNAMGAVANTAGTLASGALAAPFAGLAGLAGTALPGPQGQGADWVNRVQNALTLAPQTQGSATLTDIATKPFQWLEHGADVAGAKTAEVIGPTAGAAVKTGLAMAPALLGRLGGAKGREVVSKAEGERAATQSRQSVKDTTLNEGREAGYVVPPEESMLRGIAGKAALRQEAIARNQGVTDALARKVAGLPEESALTRGTLDKRINDVAAPYREIEALSAKHPLFQPPFKNPAQTLKDLQEARFNANAWHQYANRTGSPVHRKRAEKFDDKAEALESSIEKAAEALGKPDLVQRLRDARKKIAQIHEIKRALNEGDGTVDAHIIGNAYDKNPGKYTGELATIGKFDQAFRKYTAPRSTTPDVGGGALAPHAAAALGIAGHGTGLGWVPAGLPMLGGPARSTLLSGLYQQSRTYGPGLMEMLGRAASNEGTPMALAAGQAGTRTLEDIIREASRRQ